MHFNTGDLCQFKCFEYDGNQAEDRGCTIHHANDGCVIQSVLQPLDDSDAHADTIKWTVWILARLRFFVALTSTKMRDKIMVLSFPV